MKTTTLTGRNKDLFSCINSIQSISGIFPTNSTYGRYWIRVVSNMEWGGRTDIQLFFMRKSDAKRFLAERHEVQSNEEIP